MEVENRIAIPIATTTITTFGATLKNIFYSI